MTRLTAAQAGVPEISEAEETLAKQLTAMGIPYEREFRFAPPRRWRADFLVGHTVFPELWQSDHLLVEVDGGAFVNGRHTSGAGFRADAEKASAAAIAGYRVIRCLPEHVESGECLRWIEQAR